MEQTEVLRARVLDILKDINLGLYSALMTVIGVMIGFASSSISPHNSNLLKFFIYVYFCLLIIAEVRLLELYLWQRAEHSAIYETIDRYEKNSEEFTVDKIKELYEKNNANRSKRLRREREVFVTLGGAMILQLFIMIINTWPMLYSR